MVGLILLFSNHDLFNMCKAKKKKKKKKKKKEKEKKEKKQKQKTNKNKTKFWNHRACNCLYIPRESKKIVQELQMSLTLIKSLNHRFVVVLMKKT